MKLLLALFSCILIFSFIFWTGCTDDQNITTSPNGISNIDKKGSGNPSPTSPNGDQVNPSSQSGTSLSATVTHTCFNHYEWAVEKTVEPDTIMISPDMGCPSSGGTGGVVTVNVTASRTLVSGVTGEICVTNDGGVATTDLRIMAYLLRNCGGGTGYYVIDSVLVDVSGNPVLNPGESHCYSYTIYAPITTTCSYKVNGDVTITNHSGRLGQPFGPGQRNHYPYGVGSESAPGCAPVDQCATVYEVVTLPEGFELYSIEPALLSFCESGSGQFTLTICNNNQYCWDEFYSLIDTVLLYEQNSQTVRIGTYPWYISTLIGDGCTPPPPDGNGQCTRTIGYWKTHAVPNLYGRNQDMVSDCLPIALGDGGPKTLNVTVNTQVVSIMQRVGPGGASNGILKLYSQLLAAKLNQCKGTDISCISGVIADADAFLGQYDANDWSGLSRQQRNQVLKWMSTLDEYNNGLMCAPHCP